MSTRVLVGHPVLEPPQTESLGIQLILFLGFLKNVVLIDLFSVCVGVAYGGQKTAVWNGFSPSSTGVPGSGQS